MATKSRLLSKIKQMECPFGTYTQKDKMPYQYRIISQIAGNVEYLVKLERKFKRQIIDTNDRYTPKISFGGSTYECFKGKFVPNFEEIE